MLSATVFKPFKPSAQKKHDSKIVKAAGFSIPVKPIKVVSYGIKDPIPAAIVVPGSAFPDTDTAKVSKRKENNRLSAAKSRANRKAQGEQREQQILELQRANADLLNQVNALTQTVLALQQQALSYPDVNPAYEAWVDGLLD